MSTRGLAAVRAAAAMQATVEAQEAPMAAAAAETVAQVAPMAAAAAEMAAPECRMPLLPTALLQRTLMRLTCAPTAASARMTAEGG